MNEDNSHRRYRPNAANKNLHSDLSSKDLALYDYSAPEFDRDTSHHIEDMRNGNSNILVAVRIRPLNSKEHSISNFETLRVLENKVVVLLDPQNEFDTDDVLRHNRNREKQYAFDHAFSKEASTEVVFQNTTKFLIEGVLNGYNATVFAYGATGAGKTFTMMGYGDRAGLMDLTLNELYNEIEKFMQEKDFAVKVSYLEVYNETLRDLLSSEDTSLDLREDPVRGNCVAGITEIITSSTSEVIAMLKIGNKNRIMEATGANQVSSRSHAVLQILVEQKNKDQGVVEEVTIGKLSLIDLAGSERAANTNNRGIRMIEGANINKSLLALGNCITMLSEQNDKGGKAYIPYRDSKLTRLLKDSLGGNCRTVMIANLSPAAASFEDTHNTLKYANRAKNIKTNASRNVLEVSNHVAKYAQIISTLRNENEVLRRQVQEQKAGKMPIDHNMSGASVNEKLQMQIQEHFDHEMGLKTKIYDMEDQLEVIGQQVFKSMMELKTAEDKSSRERLEAFKLAQKDMSARLEDLQIEYNGVYSRRNVILQEINSERRDSMNLLMSVFKQLQYTMENMEFQHRDKQSDSHLKSKDLQIVYLQNQLLLRDEVMKDQRSLLDNNKIKHAINYNNIKTIQDIDQEARMALPLYKGTVSSSPKKFGSPGRSKQSEYPSPPGGNTGALPIIHRSLPLNVGKTLQRKATQPTRNDLNSSIDSGSYPVNRNNNVRGGSNKPQLSPHTGKAGNGNGNRNGNGNGNDDGKYYFNKQVMYKYRYEKPVVSVRPKRKIGYLPAIDMQNQNNNDYQSDKGARNKQPLYSHRRIQGNLNRSVDTTPRRRSDSLSDLSYMSTASSSSQKGKNRVLVDKSRSKQVIPNVMKERAMHPHAHIPSRYKESPYVMKFQDSQAQAQARKNRYDNDGMPLETSSEKNLRHKAASPTPNSLRRIKSKGLKPKP